MRKPVTILTGFLGSGKTTFLNQILQDRNDTKFAIIENEFGAQGIDNELIIRPDESIVQLNNGCLCCTLNDNLYDILNELHERRDEFNEIIIEATGVADPTGLAQPFIAHPLIKKHFPIKSIICLTDAELIEDHLDETEEAIQQLTYSDIVLINKIDLVTETYVDQLKSKLKELNPLAQIITGRQQYFENYGKAVENQDVLEKIFQSVIPEKKLNDENLSFPVSKGHSHHHHHTKEIISFTLTFDTPFDFAQLNHRIMVYLTFQSQGLYRMKGLLWIEGEEERYVLQSVGKRYDIAKERSWKTSEQKKSVIVFIGKNLKREGLEKMLQQCISKTKQTI